MDIQIFTKSFMQPLCDSFDKELNAAQTKQYYKNLQNVSEADLLIVLTELQKHSKKFPYISEVLNYSASINGKKIEKGSSQIYITVECSCGGTMVVPLEKVLNGQGSVKCRKCYYTNTITGQPMCTNSFALSFIKNNYDKSSNSITFKMNQ